MSDPAIPQSVEEAEKLGLKRASAEEIATRRGTDFPMDLLGNTHRRNRDPRIVDCAGDDTNGKPCQIGACINGVRLIYYCRGHVCDDLAYAQEC
ncbi:hypothetical protein [Bradyrhizobium sp. 131]|uniref:hypothetical protein n=1 Tax=Bradyrhizobium sp. 131 TaxID=2782609 RepID=UPI001FFF1489|nr:hypothetical protein [Bradyrhizobium sp. 131]UPK23113.1 hypothetical protein IVA73_38315 [Bradyrhizobium sp. 131]